MKKQESKIMYKPIKLTPPQLLALTFICLIAVGGILLKLPFATESEISWVDAFFMSASAATCTGLASVDPVSTLTRFGELVIMLLVQVGGLGIMTFAVLVVIMLGKKVGIKQRLVMQEALNHPSLGGVIRLVRNLLIFAFAMELIGVIFLAVKWVPEMGWQQGIYYSVFHAVAAFNNAGFALWPDNLSRFVGDPLINLVISFLFITGGLGFTVMFDMLYQRFKFRQLSLHSKVMLISTLVINVIAVLAFFLFEAFNSNTLGKLTTSEKFWAAYFQAISPRTAGFNTIDIGALNEPTLMLIILLMFVGAGSTSTGGGIKLTTFIVIVYAVINFIKGKEETVIFQRTIRNQVIFRSLAILSVSIGFIFIATMTLALSEDTHLMPVFFEVVSAFGTVGLSMNFTSHLSDIGKIIIVCTMFLGKLGPLTLLYSVSKPEKVKIRYPEGELFTG